MKKISLNKITRNGKALYLAYDQGLEHGPESDFSDKNVDPLYVLDIAKKGRYNGIVYQIGIAEKYHQEIMKSKVPLILKLNGKTKLVDGEPLSAQLASVKDALRLKASAVGFTIYIGSKYESKMMEEFSIVEKEAHNSGLPVIAWIYPRGSKIKNDVSRENMAYSCRVGLEIGADIVKVKYGGNKNDLKWAVRAAGRTKVVIAGGTKKDEKTFLKQVKDIIESGAIGLAIGRNIWQNNEPLKITEKIKRIIWGEV